MRAPPKRAPPPMRAPAKRAMKAARALPPRPATPDRRGRGGGGHDGPNHGGGRHRAGGGADHGGRGRDRDAPGEEAPRDSLMEHWYQGYSRPGARVHSDFVGCIRSGDLLEAVILDATHVERGNVLCEVAGQRIDSGIHKSITYVSVLAASEADLLAWAVSNLGAPGGIHLCKGDARDEDLSGHRGVPAGRRLLAVAGPEQAGRDVESPPAPGGRRRYATTTSGCCRS